MGGGNGAEAAAAAAAGGNQDAHMPALDAQPVAYQLEAAWGELNGAGAAAAAAVAAAAAAPNDAAGGAALTAAFDALVPPEIRDDLNTDEESGAWVLVYDASEDLKEQKDAGAPPHVIETLEARLETPKQQALKVTQRLLVMHHSNNAGAACGSGAAAAGLALEQY
jgi:hypothetical protein